MKRILSLTATLCLSVYIIACNSILDVQPQLTASYDQALNSTRGLNNAVNGAYSLFIDGSFAGGNSGMIGEVLADHANFQGSDAFGFGQMVVRQMELVNTVGRSTWENGYSVINRANLVIDAIDAGKIQDITFAANRDRIRGEALFVRAFSHFDLVRLFAAPWGFTADNSHPGIPYRTVGTQGPQNAKTVRGPLAQVYTRIVEDLQAAVPLLPEVAPKGKPSRWAARALLARVYLQQERYAEAFTEADAVIRGPFSLTDSVRSVWFTPNTNEAIYELPSERDLQDGAGGYRGLLSAELGGGAAAIAISTDLQRLFEASQNDRRRTSLFAVSIGRIYTTRFDELWTNFPILRVAEMYLIRAEAGFRTNRPVEQIRADINQTRVRAGLSAAALQSLSGDALFRALQTERALELALQGHRLHDLRRWRLPVANGSLPGATVLPWNDGRLVVPRPDREVSVNPE
ncbi:MAG: RagB/SusD family nutrient uptake outer membrane protein [Candidatus Kapaibacterium sp.]|nr:MAG: RagB/SusD family nutrient uptake outer membrane protein [Candidatus Kapabacteria bacterium]